MFHTALQWCGFCVKIQYRIRGNMKIDRTFLKGILISTMILSCTCVQAKLSPEASLLYQQACTAEHQQDLKGAIEKLEQAIQISGDDVMLYTKLAGMYSETDQTDKALEIYNFLGLEALSCLSFQKQ